MKQFNSGIVDQTFSSSNQQPNNTTTPTTTATANGNILRDAFLEFDRNSDGFISKEELHSVMSSFGYVVTSQELNAMVALVDADGNDLIDFHEFSTLMEGYLTVQDVDEEMRNMFALIDLDSDGFLTAKEIRSMMKKLGEKPRKKDIRKMMKEADKNGDGVISYDEFKDMCLNGNMFSCCR
jgi:calmodulin